MSLKADLKSSYEDEDHIGTYVRAHFCVHPPTRAYICIYIYASAYTNVHMDIHT